MMIITLLHVGFYTVNSDFLRCCAFEQLLGDAEMRDYGTRNQGFMEKNHISIISANRNSENIVIQNTIECHDFYRH